MLPSTPPSSSLPQTTRILAADGSPIAYLYDESRTAVPLAQISPLMQDAIVAVEDSRFYQDGAIEVARTPARKLRETRLAVTVEHQLTQQQILERYLNIVYFGEHSYGVEAAAQRYSPSLRRDVVLADMREQGMITPAQFTDAVATPVTVHGSAPAQGCEPAAGAGAALRGGPKQFCTQTDFHGE